MRPEEWIPRTRGEPTLRGLEIGLQFPFLVGDHRYAPWPACPAWLRKQPSGAGELAELGSRSLLLLGILVVAALVVLLLVVL